MSGDPPNRRKILQAALHCVALYGPDRMSIASVAETAGVSRGTVYKYFTNSEDLLQALAEFVRSRFHAGVQDAIALGGDLREKLGHIVDARMDDETRRAVMRLRELQPTFTLEFLTAHAPDFVAVYEEALRPDFEEGDFRIGLHEFAEILCRVVVTETLLMDDLDNVKSLVYALFDAINAGPVQSKRSVKKRAAQPVRPVAKGRAAS